MFAVIAGWFLLTLAIAWPLAEAPVVDSWVYRYAVDGLRAGRLAFPGYTQVCPVALAVYGALWSRWFGSSSGSSYVTLDSSTVVLGALGGLLMYMLARRCHAGKGRALLASGLLVANPCYLFLSFAFMSDVPYVVMLLAGLLAFAVADAEGGPWPWICGLLLLLAFLVRPFALGAIAAGIGAAMLIAPADGGRQPSWRLAIPLVVAFAACLLFTAGLNRAMPQPWMLTMHEQRFRYLGLVSVWHYLVAGIVGPAMYLGLVLSPLAIGQLFSSRWRLGLALAAALLGVTIAGLAVPGLAAIPELSCCGGWDNALVLRGIPHFFWPSAVTHFVALVLGALGASGLILAALAISTPTRALVTMLLGAAIYWAAAVPLWFYNDRYYLVLLPAGCLLLAAAPAIERSKPITLRPSAGQAPAGGTEVSRPLAMALLAWPVISLVLLGWMAIGGVYAQQRGLQAVLDARDGLLRAGVQRSAIDAGYPLNGSDLYRRPGPGQIDSPQLESGIPLVTSSALNQYTIAMRVLPGTAIVRHLSWPSLFNWGRRDIWVLKRAEGTVTRAPGRDLFVIATSFPPINPRFIINLLGMMVIASLPLLMAGVFVLGKCRVPLWDRLSRRLRPPRWSGRPE